MPRFAYEAFERSGQRKAGTVHALTELQALEQLSKKGLTPVELTQDGSAERWWNREVSLSGKSSVKPADLELFFDTFSTLLASQFPVSRALSFCEEQTRNRELADAIAELRAGIENGETFTASLENQAQVFPRRLRTMLGLGENSNTLPQAAAKAAELLQTENELRRQVTSAMVYPVILIGMSLLVLALIVFYLAPTLAPVFVSAGVEAPPMLRAMVAVRTAVAGNPLLTMGVVLVSCGLFFMARGFLFSLLVGALSYVPAIARYSNSREALRVCQSLELMLGAGASLPEALTAAQDAAISETWRAILREAQLEVEAGASLSASLGGFDQFDPIAYSLLSAGEESNDLPRMLNLASTRLQSETRLALQRALRLLTPSITLLIGAVVGVLIVSTITAILDLNDIAI